MKNYIQYIFVVLALCLFSACDDNNGAEDLFDETASQRVDARTEELKSKLLAAENGWKMTYFTDAREFGGFLFLMQFNEDGTLVMTSDTDDDISVKTSRYDFKLGNTVKLSFSTKNDIHNLSDAGINDELKGEGYKGSGEFYYIGEDESGNLIFTSVRNKEEERITFEKATEEDWKSTIQNSIQIANNLVGGTDAPVFKGIRVINGSTEVIYPYTLDEMRRFISVSGTDSNGKIVDKSFGISYNEKGLYAYPGLEYGGVTFNEFTWIEKDRKFVATSGKMVAEILFLDKPIVISDDYLLVNNVTGGGANRFSFRDDRLGATQYTSTNFIDRFNKADDAIDTSTSRDLYRFEIRFKGDDTGKPYVYYRYRIGESEYTMKHYFTYEIKDKKIILKDDGWDDAPSSRIEALKPLDEIFFTPEGFYVEVVPEKFYYTNVIYVFTSAGDATIQFPTYAAVLN